MELVFDDQALADLDGTFDGIAKDSPATAKVLVDRPFTVTTDTLWRI
jgi:plasmid stabilization system protein ParE